MSTLKLEVALEQACKDLSWVQTAVASVRAAGTLSSQSYAFFESSLGLATELEHAKNMLPVRDIALQAAKAFPRLVSPRTPDKFLFNGAEVTFKQGRYLLLQNYLATTWAIYDVLAKVAGVLCCTDGLAKNLTKPVKLYEDFLQGKQSVGARLQDHLRGSYGWPISISYKARNWVVHDGFTHDGVELFAHDSPVASGEFAMSDSAWEALRSLSNTDPEQTRLAVPPDVKGNLIEGLSTCNAEADEAIGFIITWATGSLRLQATILFPRDSISPPPFETPTMPTVAPTI